MDRQTFIQLDRIEQKLDTLHEEHQHQAEQDVEDLLEQFYEEEILNEEGDLHHLARDPIVRKYFEDEEEAPPRTASSGTHPSPPTKPAQADDEYRQR